MMQLNCNKNLKMSNFNNQGRKVEENITWGQSLTDFFIGLYHPRMDLHNKLMDLWSVFNTKYGSRLLLLQCIFYTIVGMSILSVYLEKRRKFSKKLIIFTLFLNITLFLTCTTNIHVAIIFPVIMFSVNFFNLISLIRWRYDGGIRGSQIRSKVTYYCSSASTLFGSLFFKWHEYEQEYTIDHFVFARSFCDRWYLFERPFNCLYVFSGPFSFSMMHTLYCINITVWFFASVFIFSYRPKKFRKLEPLVRGLKLNWAHFNEHNFWALYASKIFVDVGNYRLALVERDVEDTLEFFWKLQMFSDKNELIVNCYWCRIYRLVLLNYKNILGQALLRDIIRHFGAEAILNKEEKFWVYTNVEKKDWSKKPKYCYDSHCSVYEENLSSLKKKNV